ncbi:hypothetical protein C8R47DRAFT_1221770 [Mycena vitilis]|nr:hypothetical protein C8R47DRAFT_1221770 [Mycena vitilis]
MASTNSTTLGTVSIVNEDLNEDLAELDTGAAIQALKSLSLADPPISTPSTHRAQSQHPTKLRHHSHRTTAKLKANVLLGRRPRHSCHRGRVSPIQAVFKVRKLRIASTGWIGLADHGVAPEDTAVNAEEQGSAPTHTLTDFFGPTATIPGFTLVPYLGPEAHPILDSSGPSISEERQSHRRGVFTQLTAGVSFGGGQVQPGALVNGAINAAILASLLSSDPFIRLAGFATGLFATWAPNLFDFYRDYMGRFYRRYTHLKRPFLNGIFSACTFNLGPHTCALGHRDFANFALGWCPITAFGRFDYKKGGHLILWDCRLILEFPPGCTIIIPSAAIFHSNIPIAPHERRYSFTQYTAGGLFRWVEHGFKTEEEYLATLTAEGRREEKELGLRRAREAAAMFSTLDELKAM